MAFESERTDPPQRESNRLRRLREPLERLPDPYPSTHEDRSESERRGHHLVALRHRVDQLVRIENEFGPEQKNLHRNRAERNALIWVLQQLSGEPRPPEPPRRERRPATQYAAEILQECESLIAEGYVRADERAGLLLHRTEDAAPLEVPLAVWFYFRGRGDSA